MLKSIGIIIVTTSAVKLYIFLRPTRILMYAIIRWHGLQNAYGFTVNIWLILTLTKGSSVCEGKARSQVATCKLKKLQHIAWIAKYSILPG